MAETNFNGEFGHELLKATPYAYSLHLKGGLSKTISCKDTKCLYFFSENHEERYEKRHIQSGTKWKDPLPFGTVHRKEPPESKHWIPPPYKEFFRNKIKQERPIVVISNKYNLEWDRPPINFIPAEILIKIVEVLKGKYKVYYNRPTQLTPDNSEIFDLKEKEVAKQAGAILLEEEYELHKEKMTFNTFQMAIFAECERFVSVQGGNSVLASYFGGTNLILAKRGQELGCNSFSWYSKLSGCKISVFGKEESLVKAASSL